MYSFFDFRFDPTEVDDNGCLSDFNPGTILNATLDRLAEKIPLFIKFFHRQSLPKTCIICTKSKHDIDYENVNAWKIICKEYRGPWMWDILAFPTAEIQICDHDIDVCRECTAGHISSVLDSEGYAACDRLCCPQCSRHFSYQEVIALVDAKTLEQYVTLTQPLRMADPIPGMKSSFLWKRSLTSQTSAGALIPMVALVVNSMQRHLEALTKR